MFSFGGAAFSAAHEPEKEREAPPRPTPIAFPDHERLSRASNESWNIDHQPNLFKRFAKIRKPTDATRDHIHALNVNIQCSCPLEDVIPGGHESNSCLPPKSWMEPDATVKQSYAGMPANVALMSNGRPAPDRDAFYSRAKELLVENDSAYRVIARTTPKGQTPPRLANFRRFWEGMDSLSHYWDTSADDYYIADANGPGASRSDYEVQSFKNQMGDSDVPVLLNSSVSTQVPPRKRTKTSDSGDVSRPNATIDDSTSSSSSPASEGTAMDSKSTSSNPGLKASSPAPQPLSKSPEAEPPTNPNPRLRYRGYRVACGSQIPLSFLTDTVRAFTEACAWPHSCSLTSPRRLPQLQIAASQHSPSPTNKVRTRSSHASTLSIPSRSRPEASNTTSSIPTNAQNPTLHPNPHNSPQHHPHPRSGKLLLPLRLTALLYRTPADRARARAGHLEGPVLALWARAETGVGRVTHDPFEHLSSSSQEAFRHHATSAEDSEGAKQGEGGEAKGIAGNKKEVLDMLNEVGALLFMAQERARDGSGGARRPGEGRWWGERARWGGGEGGEVGNPEGNTDELSGKGKEGGSSSGGGGSGLVGKDGSEQEQEEKKKAKEEARKAKERDRAVAMAMEARAARTEALMGKGMGLGRDARRGSEGKGKVSAAEAWKVVRPGLGHWDQKVDFKAIGREPGSVWDHVFLVSSMNHHISILKLRVHAAYIAYITHGEWPDPAPNEEDWDKPLLQRSSWYDLFNMEQRAEAMRGIWGALTYQTRALGIPEVDMKG
ncbi:MAG: hypothetical protein M1821_004525 [Bathelium mastoideum]|nr:MAG: hypothetical protein M1821_004525 [Bathelium mastoideum]